MSVREPITVKSDRRDGFWRRLTLGGILGLVVGCLWWVWNGALNADEGFYLLSSVRVTEGLRPWSDYGFTQMPLIAYANVIWLKIWGIDLVGIRLASLSWFMGTVLLGTLLLKRRHGWASAALWVFLLLSAPVALDLMVKGKAYALAGLAVLGGQLVLMGASRSRTAWACFLLAAAVGVGTRLPSIAFFGPAWIGMLVGCRTARVRLQVLIATGAAAGVVFFALVGPDLESFWWWTVEFHRESLVSGHVGRNWGTLSAFAPGVWLAGAGAVWLGRRSGTKLKWVWLPLVFAVMVNVLPGAGYVEYLTIFVPALAALVAPAWAGMMHRTGSKAGWCMVFLGLALLGGGQSPIREDTVLQDAAGATV